MRGKAPCRTSRTPIRGNHPRVCGEKGQLMQGEYAAEGSPPRMRGKAHLEKTFCNYSGITPAYAGKRNWCPLAIWKRWDHPRVCGEKRLILLVFRAVTGSPPRVRGKVIRCSICQRGSGITPACAGKRAALWQHYAGVEDHPRVCGEKSYVKMTLRWFAGSPPRVRGKASGPGFGVDALRITPACAGKRS